MGHFRSNLRDIEFNLFEVFRVQEHLGSGPFEGVDVDVARDTLRELNAVATGPLAASFADADRHPPVFDPATHSVALPAVAEGRLPRAVGRRVVAASACRSSSAATACPRACSGRRPS